VSVFLPGVRAVKAGVIGKVEIFDHLLTGATEKALFVKNFEEVCRVREKKMKMQQKKLRRAQTGDM
jgi:hypothetical protein